MPHAVFSAPVFDAHTMKQLAHAGAEGIMLITTEVGLAAVATDMSCSCVHGPAAAAVGALVGLVVTVGIVGPSESSVSPTSTTKLSAVILSAPGRVVVCAVCVRCVSSGV